MVQPSYFVFDRVEVEKNIAHLLIRRIIVRLTRVLFVFGIHFTANLTTSSDLRSHGMLLYVFRRGFVAELFSDLDQQIIHGRLPLFNPIEH